MIAVNYSSLRSNMKAYMDKVSDGHETLVVTRKNGRNVVMISEESYNKMLENLHLRSDSANYEWLLESKQQLTDGKLVITEVN